MSALSALPTSSSCCWRRMAVRRPFIVSTPYRTYSDANNKKTAAAAPAGYVSPLKEIFDRMHNNGPTEIGTTDEIEEWEKQLKANERKLECGIPERSLRFQGTSFGRTFVPPYVHPNEHRVIMKVSTKHLPFQKGSPEYEILREIVGNRLNDQRHELRLASNQFGSRIENKRHLVSMLDRIILSCQRIGANLEKEKSENNDDDDDDDSKKEQESA